jgi:hypothetical protein
MIYAQFLIAAILLFSNVTLASERRNPSHFYELSNRLSFNNDGGLFNGGVCWWHSRLQRSAFYLASFNKHAPKPEPNELKSILRKLRYFKGKVVIPGFENFNQFSSYYNAEIQKLLNKWQIQDGFIYQQWIRGISGSPQDVSSTKYKNRMKSLFERFQKKSIIPWVMWQFKGITSHALLIVGMQKTAKGFVLEVIDSNHSLKTINVSDENPLAIFLGFESDVKNIEKILSTSKAKSVM